MVSAALPEVLVIDILHTCECILLFVLSCYISRPRLTEATSALKPFVIIRGAVSWMSYLPLACSLLHQLVLIPQTDHIARAAAAGIGSMLIVTILLLVVGILLLSHVSLGCPRVY